MVHGVPPYPYVRESLQLLADQADMIVVSATPLDALRREWKEHKIAQYVEVIAGQEMGKKQLHLALAAGGKYAPNHVLMIGDAPGDMKAARANSMPFFPVNPGHEEQSWEQFFNEASDRFHEGTYDEAYEKGLVDYFTELLPDTPAWMR